VDYAPDSFESEEHGTGEEAAPTAGAMASYAPAAEQELKMKPAMRIVMLRRQSATWLLSQSASSNRILLLLV